MNIIIDIYTPADVMNLHHSQKEILSRNRKKTGYNVFQSWFYHDWNTLDHEERRNVLVSANIHHEHEYNDDDSLVSDPPIEVGDITRLCGRVWRRSGEVLQKAWSERAATINTLPVIGAFVKVPDVIANSGMNDTICEAMTLEFDRFIAFIRSMLQKNECFLESTKEKTFGNESFLLQSQIFRSFFLNPLLKLTFFGKNNSNFYKDEIVYKTGSVQVIHIASQQRMIDLFKINGVCAFVFLNSDGIKISCGGKVVVKHRTSNLEGIGYVISEDRLNEKIIIKLETGGTIEMKKPWYEEDGDGAKSYHWVLNDVAHIEYELIQYWPIRLKLMKSGYIHITINKFKLRETNNNLIIF